MSSLSFKGLKYYAEIRVILSLQAGTRQKSLGTLGLDESRHKNEGLRIKPHDDPPFSMNLAV